MPRNPRRSQRLFIQINQIWRGNVSPVAPGIFTSFHFLPICLIGGR